MVHPCRFFNGIPRLQEVFSQSSSLRPVVFAEHVCRQRKKRFPPASYLLPDISVKVNQLPPSVATHSSSQTHGLEMQRYLVKPTEPTILSHKEYHEVSSINLLLSWTVSLQLQNDIRGATLTPTREQVPTSNVVPEILDIERFNVALSRTLSSFPHIAGRLVRPDTPDAPWKVRYRFISSLALS